MASLRRDGLRDSLLAVGAVAIATLLAAVAQRILGLDRAHGAGLFAGAVTSTPALAAAIEALKQAERPEQALSGPVIAYSICYPMGVLGVVLAIRVAWRLWRPDLAAEAKRLAELGAANEPLSIVTVHVTRDMGPLTIEELSSALRWRVIFGRLRHGDQLRLAVPDARLGPGDLVTVVGTQAELDRVVERLGSSRTNGSTSTAPSSTCGACSSRTLRSPASRCGSSTSGGGSAR